MANRGAGVTGESVLAASSSTFNVRVRACGVAFLVWQALNASGAARIGADAGGIVIWAGAAAG